jgi:transcriptional regulator with XRE-family HTH domain
MAKADLERAKELYPSCHMGMEEWTNFFGTAAGLRAMGRILYDIYDELMSKEEREAGKRRIGRRPARSAVPLSVLMTVVRPEEFSNDPLPEALRKLLRGRSQRAFARKVPCSQPYLCRVLTGERPPDLEMIERLAQAAGVQPWHFPEWRAQYLGALITEVLQESPHLGITAIKGVRTTRMRVERVTANA